MVPSRVRSASSTACLRCSSLRCNTPLLSGLSSRLPTGLSTSFSATTACLLAIALTTEPATYACLSRSQRRLPKPRHAEGEMGEVPPRCSRRFSSSWCTLRPDPSACHSKCAYEYDRLRYYVLQHVVQHVVQHINEGGYLNIPPHRYYLFSLYYILCSALWHAPCQAP